MSKQLMLGTNTPTGRYEIVKLNKTDMFVGDLEGKEITLIRNGEMSAQISTDECDDEHFRILHGAILKTVQ